MDQPYPSKQSTTDKTYFIGPPRIGLWIIAENKLSDQQKLHILFIKITFTNEHNIYKAQE